MVFALPMIPFIIYEQGAEIKGSIQLTALEIYWKRTTIAKRTGFGLAFSGAMLGLTVASFGLVPLFMGIAGGLSFVTSIAMQRRGLPFSQNSALTSVLLTTLTLALGASLVGLTAGGIVPVLLVTLPFIAKLGVAVGLGAAGVLLPTLALSSAINEIQAHREKTRSANVDKTGSTHKRLLSRLGGKKTYASDRAAAKRKPSTSYGDSRRLNHVRKKARKLSRRSHRASAKPAASVVCELD